MKLFWWDDLESLRDYATGDLIVHASSLEEAQNIVKKECSSTVYEDMMKSEPEIYGDDEPVVIEFVGSA